MLGAEKAIGVGIYLKRFRAYQEHGTLSTILYVVYQKYHPRFLRGEVCPLSGLLNRCLSKKSFVVYSFLEKINKNKFKIG